MLETHRISISRMWLRRCECFSLSAPLLFLSVFDAVPRIMELFLWCAAHRGSKLLALECKASLFLALGAVWALLQPRDYINSHQLVIGLISIILGIMVVQPQIVAPVFQANPEGAPSWFPFSPQSQSSMLLLVMSPCHPFHLLFLMPSSHGNNPFPLLSLSMTRWSL